jgi:exodeoxyribonuclease V beta subunit
MSETLDPLTLPLSGSRLIEASAGTGQDLDHRRALPAPGARPWRRARLRAAAAAAEILVMTFTRAATRELSDRIRARLLRGCVCLPRRRRERLPTPCWPRCVPPTPRPRPRNQAAWRLAMAAEAMDDAAVHTIDAWCQRMLREHAFDSGCPFDEELAADETCPARPRPRWTTGASSLPAQRRQALELVLALATVATSRP